jgi:hypothetical protein
VDDRWVGSVAAAVGGRRVSVARVSRDRRGKRIRANAYPPVLAA